MLRSLLLLLALVTPTQIDDAGRAAYLASRDFQREELRAWTAHERWPTLEEHRDITAKLAIAREGIDDTLLFSVDLAAGQPMSPPMHSMLRNVGTAVAGLVLDVGPRATKQARKTMQTFQDRFAALFDLFPAGGHEDEHPPR